MPIDILKHKVTYLGFYTKCLYEPVKVADESDYIDDQPITMTIHSVQQEQCVATLVVDDVTADCSEVYYLCYGSRICDH